jgi:hypothetical protein
MSCSSLLMWFAAVAGLITVPLFSNVAGLLPDDTAVSEIQPSIVIIENVDTNGGVEVFEQPDRSVGRLFAASMGFQPHAAGRFEDWILIYYFDRGVLTSGWAPGSQLILTEEELSGLPIVAPDNLPPMPELAVNDLASRPYGVQAVNTPPPSSPDPPPPGQAPQATSPPPQATTAPTVPPPNGTEEVTDQ